MTAQTEPVARQTAGARTTSTQPEAPRDHRVKPYLLARKSTHRFPAATYLHGTVAREERAFAKAALEATGRSTARRAGALFVVVLGLFCGLLFMIASGRTETSVEILVGWGVGALIVMAIGRLVVLLRRHERDHELLADRVRAYETRLLELRAERQLQRQRLA